jgi:5-methylcytosine-specific restriction protein A
VKNSPMPPRKSRLSRVPLQRTTELPWGGNLSRGAGTGRTVPLSPVSGKPAAGKQTTPRDTGFSPAVSRLIKARDKWCAGCGINVTGIPYSIQHRVARGMGGTSRAEIGSPVNGALLCGTATTPSGCHLACEQRDPEMRRRGLWLPSWVNPAEVPVGYATPDGLAWFLLNPDGSLTEVDEPEEVAA